MDFARPDRHGRIDLSVNGDDLAVRMFGMFDEQEPFRQFFQNGEIFFETINDNPAGHAAEKLLRNDAMQMRVIPE